MEQRDREAGKRGASSAWMGRPDYEVWNPCHGLAEVREWVATTMGRVMRNRADGIRLDGTVTAAGPATTKHSHTFQEPGITQWRNVAEATRMIRQEMDESIPISC